MPRLPRPPIPLEAKLRVLLRQLGEMWPDDDVESCKRQRIMGEQVRSFMLLLADQLGCEMKDLRLDHDHALENREKLVRLASGRKKRVMIVPDGAEVLRYFPDANDPEYLIYRTSHAHHIKTNVAGDGAQYADNVLAKRERRRAKKEALRLTRDGKKSGTLGAGRGSRIPSRPLRSGNSWPPRGSRKFNRRHP